VVTERLPTGAFPTVLPLDVVALCTAGVVVVLVLLDAVPCAGSHTVLQSQIRAWNPPKRVSTNLGVDETQAESEIVHAVK
jgi:hypothetical protein